MITLPVEFEYDLPSHTDVRAMLPPCLTWPSRTGAVVDCRFRLGDSLRSWFDYDSGWPSFPLPFTLLPFVTIRFGYDSPGYLWFVTLLPFWLMMFTFAIGPYHLHLPFLLFVYYGYVIPYRCCYGCQCDSPHALYRYGILCVISTLFQICPSLLRCVPTTCVTLRSGWRFCGGAPFIVVMEFVLLCACCRWLPTCLPLLFVAFMRRCSLTIHSSLPCCGRLRWSSPECVTGDLRAFTFILGILLYHLNSYVDSYSDVLSLLWLFFRSVSCAKFALFHAPITGCHHQFLWFYGSTVSVWFGDSVVFLPTLRSLIFPLGVVRWIDVLPFVVPMPTDVMVEIPYGRLCGVLLLLFIVICRCSVRYCDWCVTYGGLFCDWPNAVRYGGGRTLLLPLCVVVDLYWWWAGVFVIDVLYSLWWGAWCWPLPITLIVFILLLRCYLRWRWLRAILIFSLVFVDVGALFGCDCWYIGLQICSGGSLYIRCDGDSTVLFPVVDSTLRPSDSVLTIYSLENWRCSVRWSVAEHSMEYFTITLLPVVDYLLFCGIYYRWWWCWCWNFVIEWICCTDCSTILLEWSLLPTFIYLRLEVLFCYDDPIPRVVPDYLFWFSVPVLFSDCWLLQTWVYLITFWVTMILMRWPRPCLTDAFFWFDWYIHLTSLWCRRLFFITLLFIRLQFLVDDPTLFVTFKFFPVVPFPFNFQYHHSVRYYGAELRLIYSVVITDFDCCSAMESYIPSTSVHWRPLPFCDERAPDTLTAITLFHRYALEFTLFL